MPCCRALSHCGQQLYHMSTTTDTAMLLRRLHLSTHKGHTPGGLWEPLIPADGNAYLGILCAEHLEACVPWVEIELLLVPAYSRPASLPRQTNLSQAILAKVGWNNWTMPATCTIGVSYLQQRCIKQ